MALLAEEIVEEWLNRQAWFTIRGIRVGVDEIDILAVRPTPAGTLECRHLEVQASMRPVSYVSKLTKEDQRSSGRAPNSAKRSRQELVAGVQRWVDSKFAKKRKVELMERLAPGPWSRELVIHRVKSAEEVRMIESCGVTILHLTAIVRELRDGSFVVPSAAGADFLDLLQMSRHDESAGSVADAIAAAVYSPARRSRSRRSDKKN